ncbi:hypothetical protein [Arthrobacter glacialis]|uniref:hypothetical protein n=1 Tax=Arthrobacter glacialis TaxID=1664 RepID=UPI0010572001|nr:hypothetical protein [Arthrobacter glacialis]
MGDPVRFRGCRKYWTSAWSWRLLVPVVLLAAVSGCAPSGAGPASAAQAFYAALDGHDLAAACALLAPATIKSLAKDGDGSCPTGLEDAGLAAVGPDGRAPSATQVFGRSALVSLGAENVFLTQSGTRWLVDAAGCTAVEDAPFDCEIGGG